MKKNDYILISIVILIYIFLSFIYNGEEQNTAIIYFESKEIKQVNLDENQKFEVMGHNGPVEIEVLDNKIRVIKETSKNNICSKQGFISKSGEKIICLPNKIVIELKNNDYDSYIE